MTKSDCENCIHAKHTEGKRTYVMDDGRQYTQYGSGSICGAKRIKRIDMREGGFYCSSYEPKEGDKD